MSSVGFFTAVAYGPQIKNEIPVRAHFKYVLEAIDNYFYLGGRKAHILHSSVKDAKVEAVLLETNSSKLARVAKVVSYFLPLMLFVQMSSPLLRIVVKTVATIPLILLVAKIALRLACPIHLAKKEEDSNSNTIDQFQKALQEGITIPEDILNKMKWLFPTILSKRDHDDINWFNSNSFVFQLKNCNYVFKIANNSGYNNVTEVNESTNARFEKMVQAKQICMENKLDRLIVPHAKKINMTVDGHSYACIAEENLKFDPCQWIQEDLYEKCSKKMTETVRQLAILVAKMGLVDINPRNVPIVDRMDDEDPIRFGLIDIELKSTLQSAIIRLIWSSYTEEQIDVIIKVACEEKLFTSDQDEKLQKQKTERLNWLKTNEQLRQFYEEKNITGKELIQVNIDSLGLNLSEENEIYIGSKKQKVTLRKAAQDIVDEINTIIQDRPDRFPVKRKRCLDEIFEGSLSLYTYSGMPENESDRKQGWTWRIVQALIDKGHIFSHKFNGIGAYCIQA